MELKMMCGWSHVIRRGLLGAWLAGMAALMGCITPETQTPSRAQVPSEIVPVRPTLFRSEDYVVVELQEREDPSSLADRFLGDARRAWVIEDANEGITFAPGQTVVIPLKIRNKAGLFPQGYQVIPILCYHHFAKGCKSSLCVPDALFDQQMKYLKDNGYRVITLGELLKFLQYKEAIPKRSVVITIDDGYRSIYDIAFPILKAYDFRATLFVYTDFVNQSKNAVTWDQLKEMKAHGFEIGSHTVSHCDLAKKGEDESEEAFTARIRKELFDSKRLLDTKLSQDTISLAFPYGLYNKPVLELSAKAGYTMGVLVKRGGNPFYSDPLQLRRNQILKADMESFISGLETFHEFPLQ